MQGSLEFYQTNGETQIEVRFENDTVWLNRTQLSLLFGRDIKTIGKHLNNVFVEGELDKIATVAKFATVQIEGEREVERQIDYYNLDVIISVGYRVKIQKRNSILTMGNPTPQRLPDQRIFGKPSKTRAT